MTNANYYLVLGVPHSASEGSIRDAYLALVRQLHPDRVGAGGTSRFQEITAAYDTLSDPAKRRQYDLRCGRAVARTTRGPRVVYDRTRSGPEPLMSDPIPLVEEPEPVPPSLEGLLQRVMRGLTQTAVQPASWRDRIDLRVVLTRQEAAAGVVVPLGVLRLRLPPKVAHGTVIEVSPHAHGITDLRLRLHIVVQPP